MTIKISVLTDKDTSVLDQVAPDVFDDPINLQATKDFLADHRHHIVVAVDDAVVVGFISAVHYLHPDKSKPELWINEVGVAPSYQRQGIAKSMMKPMLQLGTRLGCGEAWVMTDRSNGPAKALYRSSGAGSDVTEHIMYSFKLGN